MCSTGRILCTSVVFVAAVLAGGAGRPVDCYSDCRSATCWREISLAYYYKVDDPNHADCKHYYRHDTEIKTVTAGSSFVVQLQRYNNGTCVCQPSETTQALCSDCEDAVASWPHKYCFEACTMQGTQ